METKNNKMSAMEVVGKHKAVFTESPRITPGGLGARIETVAAVGGGLGTGTSVDAPLLGNGDMVAAFAGEPKSAQFWITSNDFWEMENDGWLLSTESYGYVGRRPVGRVVFDIPSLTNADYHVEQDFATATTSARFAAAGGEAVIESWIAATENMLVIEISSVGSDLEVSASFLFPNELGFGADFANEPPRNHPIQQKGIDGGVIHAVRAYVDGVDQPTKAAVAGRFVGANKESVVVRDGTSVVFVTALRSWFKSINPLKVAQSRVRWAEKEDVLHLRALHEAWWTKFWSESYVELDDPAIEQRYYLSQHVMGSLSRDPEFPPCIFGIATWDDPKWCGDYKINYNHEASFLGLYSSGHFEQADPHDAPYLSQLEQGSEMARRLLRHGGVYFAIGLGPRGLVCENGTWGMKSANVMPLVNIRLRWQLTYDEEYAWRVYPFVRRVVDFWVDDLKLVDGRYEVRGDSAHESYGTEAINPVSTLGYTRTAFKLALSMSSVLNIDEECHEKWRDILDHLSPFPVKPAETISNVLMISGSDSGFGLADYYPQGSLTGKQVFCLEEEGSEWSFASAINLLHIYPAGEIGLDSPDELLKTARYTLELRHLFEKHSHEWKNSWNQEMIEPETAKADERLAGRGGFPDWNQSCLFFPIAVRIGYDPNTIWEEMRNSSPNVPLQMDLLSIIPTA